MEQTPPNQDCGHPPERRSYAARSSPISLGSGRVGVTRRARAVENASLRHLPFRRRQIQQPIRACQSSLRKQITVLCWFPSASKITHYAYQARREVSPHLLRQFPRSTACRRDFGTVDKTLFLDGEKIYHCAVSHRLLINDWCSICDPHREPTFSIHGRTSACVSTTTATMDSGCVPKTRPPAFLIPSQGLSAARRAFVAILFPSLQHWQAARYLPILAHSELSKWTKSTLS